MHTALMAADGTLTSEVTEEQVRAACGSAVPFWLDIVAMDDSGAALLTDIFKFHPLAVEDAKHFEQRPKHDDYDGFSHFVLYGANDGGSSSQEVHCFYAEAFLVTVRKTESKIFDDLRRHASSWRHHADASSIMLFYRIADALADSYFPMMARFDDEIDAIEEEILEQPTEDQMKTLFAMKRQLVGLRRVITPERDMFATVAVGTSGLPGMTEDAERYFRDLYDHLIRLSDLVDSYRDLLTSAVDTHLSNVSNRLNVVMKQLAVIATVFLPLTFLTGFFGQNFGWLVARLTSPAIFFGVGLGTELLAIVLLMMLFRKRHWLSS
jgi:magnesium transporter